MADVRPSQDVDDCIIYTYIYFSAGMMFVYTQCTCIQLHIFWTFSIVISEIQQNTYTIDQLLFQSCCQVHWLFTASVVCTFNYIYHAAMYRYIHFL